MRVDQQLTSSASWLCMLGWIVLAMPGCRKEAAPTFERPPAPVKVATAVAEDVPVYLDEIGRCVARESVQIKPQVSGRVTQIHFEDGADLKSGDLLFTIDPRPYQADLDAAEASLSQMRAALDLAKAEFARVSGMGETRAISQTEYDTRKNAVEVGEAQVKHALAQVETAKLNLEYCSIRSPIEGRAGQRQVDVGNVVNVFNSMMAGAGAPPMLTIERLDPMYVEFDITENDLMTVQKSMAGGTVKVEVRLPDDPANPRVGDLTFIDNAVQQATGTVTLRATIHNADHHFWPNRFVKVRMLLRMLHDAVLVPATAPQVSSDGPFVYVIKDGSTAEMRSVIVGQRHGDLVVISQGVSAGERVVINGQIGVTPGGKIRNIEGPESNLAAGSDAGGRNAATEHAP